MVDLRIPRGYDADTKPAYNEIEEGIRPTISNIPLVPYQHLPIFDMDRHHDDPIVLPAGTLIGVKWDGVGSSLLGAGVSGFTEGTLVPAVSDLDKTPGENSNSLVVVGSTHTSDETDWGISLTGWQAPVYPLGVVTKPIYSFPVQTADLTARTSTTATDPRTQYSNYRREHAVSLVTDYVIEVPARTPYENSLRAGDTVMVADYLHWNNDQTQGTYTRGSAGTFMGIDEWAAASLSGAGDIRATARLHNYVVGKVLSVTILGSDSNAQAGDFLQAALAASRFTKAQLSSVPVGDASLLHATSEFANLELVQTVPGHRVSGSGTKGVPGFAAGTFGARSDASGLYKLLRILLRVV